MATREEKIAEFHQHLKYREHILEFAGPKMDVTEEAAAEEPPNYSTVFDLEKVKESARPRRAPSTRGA